MKRILLVLFLAIVPAGARSQTSQPVDLGLFSKPFWASLYGAYDYSMLGDLINGTKAWVSAIQSVNPMVSSKTGNGGFGYGLELGYSLDEDNAFSIRLEHTGTAGESYSETVSGSTYTQSLAPSLESASLNYHRTLIKTPGMRTEVEVGGGLYNASVSFYSGTAGQMDSMTATFSGQALGGTLGVSEKIELFKAVILGISVKGRLAVIDQVTSSSITFNGSTDGSHAPYALMIATQGSTSGSINLASPSFVAPSGIFRYAVVDYSGVTGLVSLGLRF